MSNLFSIVPLPLAPSISSVSYGSPLVNSLMAGIYVLVMNVMQVATVSRVDFWLPQAFVLLGLLFAYIQIRRDNRNEARDNMERHYQNIARLEALRDFHSSQLVLNTTSDKQINELKIQTSTLAEIARGQGRRLEMLENR